MTLAELLTKLNEEEIYAIIHYKTKIEYVHIAPYPYDDGISTYEQDVTKIDINHKTKTITFKGEYE